jgi:uncharacterized protein (DUF1501 family)
MTDLPPLSPVDYLPAETCGCAENRRAGGVTRRAVLAGLGAIGAAAGVSRVFGTASTQYAYAGAGYAGDTVVVLSLRGGFDGLSAIAPVGDPAYAKVRPSIAVPTARAIQLDSTFGLHPALAPLKPLWDSKLLGAVHAVGAPSPTRSHFAAMEAMENAAPGSSLRTGWLDRMVGMTASTDTFSAVAVGSVNAPSSMMGPNPELSIRQLTDFRLSGVANADDLTKWSAVLGAMQEGAPASVSGAVSTTLGALATTDRLLTAGYTPASAAKYPGTDLGTALKDLANLIKAGVGLRAATVDVGDWDMHVGLGKVDDGWMFKKLTELGQALAAFAADLGPKIADVTLVTMSEFGRRVAENGSGGVDHGYGNASLLLGGGVNGGKVYGTWPGLAADQLLDGDLAVTTDYRAVLAEILEKRSQLSVAEVFPKLGTDRLGALKAR